MGFIVVRGVVKRGRGRRIVDRKNKSRSRR